MDFTSPPVTIPGFPIPPPDNQLKTPVRRWKKGGGSKVFSFMDSPVYIEYKNAVNIWYFQYARQFSEQFKQLEQWTKEGQVLGMIGDLRVYHERLYTKEGKPKKWDIANRNKALHDCFCALANFDDSLLFDVRVRKVEIERNKRECIYLRIGPITPQKDLHETSKDCLPGDGLRID